MSHEPSDPADSPKVDQSPVRKKRKDAKVNWDKVKVFAKPEYRIPFKAAIYQNGKKPTGLIAPPAWLQAAIESGLVEMGSPNADGRAVEFFDPIGAQPPARMSREELDRRLYEGIAKTLDDFEAFDKRTKADNKDNP